MSKKKQYFIYASIIILILVSALTITHLYSKHQSQKALEDSPILLGTEETMYEENPLEIGMTAFENTPPEENALEEYPDRVLILNMSELGDSSLPDIALQSLQPYLSDYLNYYWDNGVNYEGVIVEDSYKEDFNLPSFHVYIEEIDLDIECIYHTTRHFYYMYSRLNPEE